MRICSYLLLAASLWAGGCGSTEKPDDNVGDDDDDDFTTDTYTTTTETVHLEPAALGVELNAGISAEGALTYFMYAGDQSLYSPYLVLTVTDVEYFSLGSDDPEREKHYCDFYASFPHVVSQAPPTGKAFDYDSGKGATNEGVALWFFAEGRADIFANSVAVDEDGNAIYDDYGELMDSPACASLKEQGYPDVLDGMHVGVGFGDLTTYLFEEYWESFTDPDLAELQPSVQGMFVAINHPNQDAPNGYDFVPFDWGNGIFFEAFVEAEQLYDTDGNPVIVDVATATVTPDGMLEYGTPMADALVRGIPYWFEDYPNLDVSLLKEGVPALPE